MSTVPTRLTVNEQRTIKAGVQYGNGTVLALEGENMKTTIEFLDAVKVKYSLPSDYALAQILGITRSSVSKFRVGKDCLGEETACKVAELLDIEAGYVMACIASERAKKPEVKAAWKHAAEVLYGMAAALAVVVALPFITLENFETENLILATNAALSSVQCILC